MRQRAKKTASDEVVVSTRTLLSIRPLPRDFLYFPSVPEADQRVQSFFFVFCTLVLGWPWLDSCPFCDPSSPPTLNSPVYRAVSTDDSLSHFQSPTAVRNIPLGNQGGITLLNCLIKIQDKLTLGYRIPENPCGPSQRLLTVSGLACHRPTTYHLLQLDGRWPA